MKQLSNLTPGARFFYGGAEWVKLDDLGPGAFALAAEPVFERAFDEENCNDWRKSSLRRELNGGFLDGLIAAGADRAAFFDVESDLTADDGMTDYGTAADKIALLSSGLYRKFRALIPKIGRWWWTLTPWTCDPGRSRYVRLVNSSGVPDCARARFDEDVRPLCYFKSGIWVAVPGEEDSRDELVRAAKDDILNVLKSHPAKIWGDALGMALTELLKAKERRNERWKD